MMYLNENCIGKYSLFALLLLVVWSACSPKPHSRMGARQERDRLTTGFIPPVIPEGDFFPASVYLDTLPSLNFPEGNPPDRWPGVRIIYPDRGCSSWEACGLNDPDIRYFLLTPGNYVDWGVLKLTTSGTGDQKRIIRYYDPQSAHPFHPPHPVKLAGTEQEVVLESVDIWDADHWIMHRLSFRGKASNKKGFTGGLTSRLKGADHNVIDYCLFEQVLGVGVIRLFESNFNAIQNCVIRNKIEGVGVDMGGIGISARYGNESRNNRIVNNEIYNLTDGIGLTRTVARDGNLQRSQIGDVPGTIIENNDFYIESSQHRQKSDGEWACAEDGLDLKTGTKSTDPADRIRILNNRFWGFRPTDQSCGGSGSAGAGIVIHRDASHILIKGNVFFDLNQGISAFAPNRRFPGEQTEHIAIVNNLFYDLKDAIPDNPYSGLAFRLTTDVDVYYNTVVGARRLLFLKEKQNQHRFQCNTFIDIAETTPWEKNTQSWSSLNAWYDYPIPERIYAHQGRHNTIGKEAEDADLADWTMYIKRWTGPEKRVFAHAVPGGQQQGPQIKPEQGCHCGPGGEGERWWVE